MPTYEEVFEVEESSKSLKARQLLKKHLEYKDGSKKYKVLDLDSSGPTKVVLINRMDQTESVWIRKERTLKGNDYWFEKE